MASRLNPYLNFENNAREAMEFYQRVLGGELTVSTFGEAGMPDVPADGVMHAMLVNDAGYTLMASDAPPGMPASANGTVSLSGDDTETLRGYFAALSDGATIELPLAVAPWGDEFGMLRDRFGVQWMVNILGAHPGA